MDKIRDRRFNWTPKTLAEVSDEKIREDFFDPKSPFLANVPQLAVKAETSSPRRSYALPSEDEIRLLVLGSHATSGDKGQTLDSLLAHLRQVQGDKHGLTEKVTEVVSRRCKVRNVDGHGYLQWLH